MSYIPASAYCIIDHFLMFPETRKYRFWKIAFETNVQKKKDNILNDHFKTEATVNFFFGWLW